MFTERPPLSSYSPCGFLKRPCEKLYLPGPKSIQRRKSLRGTCGLPCPNVSSTVHMFAAAKTVATCSHLKNRARSLRYVAGKRSPSAREWVLRRLHATPYANLPHSGDSVNNATSPTSMKGPDETSINHGTLRRLPLVSAGNRRSSFFTVSFF